MSRQVGRKGRKYVQRHRQVSDSLVRRRHAHQRALVFFEKHKENQQMNRKEENGANHEMLVLEKGK